MLTTSRQIRVNQFCLPVNEDSADISNVAKDKIAQNDMY